MTCVSLMMCPFLYFGRIAIVEPVTIGKVSPRNEAIESSQVDYNQHLKSSIGSGITAISFEYTFLYRIRPSCCKGQYTCPFLFVVNNHGFLFLLVFVPIILSKSKCILRSSRSTNRNNGAEHK